ncbi:hypothetical protein EPUS_06908 [Endocarpon pusillum Z07020]|uniref:Dynamin-binding protein n=1 Tax=Endocarpon pusillum (strain Z07020 / HMAS-L-300199) TaxID=1263415 RepID=U1FTL1_ENDPU|nr:uncharacterized protein EPUS_06908 [Endocarpon pusillum Z07020]ERF68097.1 hypothetical protein EPUS_06908 [Endocarpon pusillum Z07020]
MASSDLGHNRYPVDHHHRPKQEEFDDQLLTRPVSTSSGNSQFFDDTALYLPATTYTNPGRHLRSKLSISTNLGARPVKPFYGQIDGPADEEVSEASPDPHEYYRSLHDPFAAGTVGQNNQHDRVRTARSNNVSKPKSSLSSVRSNGAPTQNTSRTDIRQPYQASPSSQFREGALISARSKASLPSLDKPRQASFQDLVARFDRGGGSQSVQTKVEIGNGSRNISPAASIGNSDGSSRNVSLSKKGQTKTRSAVHRPSQDSVNSSKHKTSQVAYQSPANRRESVDLGVSRTASRSVTDLRPSHPKAPRRPLFGEVVSSNPTKGTFSYGISQPVLRRGSVDSPMHSPNSMFPKSAVDSEANLSATSPDAWYRGFNPTLNAGTSGCHYDGTESQHRRAQSDVSAMQRSMQSEPSQIQNMMQRKSPVEAVNPNAGMGSRRNSQSRIPVRRRHSHASDSATSAPHSRTSTVPTGHATHQGDLSSTPMSPPDASQASGSPRRKVDPPRRTDSPNNAPARGSRNRAAQQDQKSPLLRANIIAPPPKISPPLRSSRPRIPLSNASTTSSRAKTIERLSTMQKQNRDHPSSIPRSRRPPELDNVDLEARRRKITQAFNKTIRENAQKEKVAADRRRRARERAQVEEAAQRNDSTRTIRPADVFRRQSADKDAGPEEVEGGGDVFRTPGEEFTASEKSLRVADYTVSAHRAIDTAQENGESGEGNDSPTLGRPSVFRSRPGSRSDSPSEANDMPPLSAVTADTDGTLFDNEPQIEQTEPSSVSGTVLSQIMNLRDLSPTDSPAMSDNGSEQAEKESIQIMLRNTTYYDHTESPSQERETEHDHQQTFLTEDKLDQDKMEQCSSTGSWTSSIRERSSVEGFGEPTVEKSPDHSIQRRNRHSPFSTKSNRGGSVGSQSAAEADAYKSVSRVLEKEYSTTSVNRNHFGDIYQKILEQSPDLARQGGWDTQRVTQLCLQEIDRSKYERLSKVSSPFKRSQETSDQVSASPRPDSVAPEKYVQGHKYRASLNNAEDFAFTSPSIVDWMQFAAADSPTEDREGTAPPLPPKDSKASSARDGALTPKAEHNSELSSVGLNIHIRSPTKTAVSPTPPPLRPPSHSPPPVPYLSRSIDESSAAFGQSPSIYDDTPHSSNFPHKSLSPQHPPVPRRITSLSRMASPYNFPEGLPSSSKDSMIATSGSYPSERPSLERPNLERPSLEEPTLDLASQRASPSPEQKRVIRRKHVIKELVDTEASFGRDMSVVDDIYKGTSSSCLDLSAEDVKILFGNSAQIVKFSIDFLDSLKQAAKSVYIMPKSQRFQSQRASRAASASTLATTTSDDQAGTETDQPTEFEKDHRTHIGEAFKKNLGAMEKVYTVYLKNHDAANRKLQSLQQSATVEIWLKECRQYAADLTNAWDLDSLLVKPVQRLLKYPLLIGQLLESTPDDHPDREAIKDALRELTEISVRINEMKKHSELVEQGLKRNRKESDVRGGISKVINRQTEKLKQNVGVSKVVEDREYAQVRDRYAENLAHLIVVREDVRTYMGVASRTTQRFNELALAVDGWIDVGHTNYPEKESRWRQFGMIVRELVTVAIPEHIGAIQKVVVDPMTAAAKMLETLSKDPKGLIQKRDKKSIDYARWKNMKDRGEKIDKKTSDRMEEWEALNREAKDRMLKLIDLTGHLAQGCLRSYVQIQRTWQMIWQRKLAAVVGVSTPDVSKIAKEWQEDFDYHEAQALSLGICNGSLVSEVVNLVTFATPISNFDGASSPRQPSWNGAGKRSFSINSDASPNFSTEFTPRHSGSFTASPMAETYDRASHSLPAPRMRGVSAASGPSTLSEIIVRNGSTTALNNTANQGASINRPSTSAGSSGHRSPMPPRLSLDAPSPTIGVIKPKTTTARPDSGSTFYSANGGRAPGSETLSPSPIPHTTTDSITSDVFSSALPMSESPFTATPSTTTTSTNNEDRRIDVLFLAASVYEFNIDRSRREAGFPYLTYVTGEIFDVIAERGELWLARNQDDPEKQIGWIWNKHFAKLTET